MPNGYRTARNYPCRVILTDGTVPALSRLAGSFSDAVRARRVAVTGSVGKTTTKEFISSVLSTAGKVYRTEGNRNSVIGMPLSMLEVGDDADYAVFEMGMSGFGEIESMSLAARPDIAVITNIGSSHLEYLGTRENIAKAKLEIRAGLAKNGMLLLNGDEPLLAGIRATDQRAVYFSASGRSDADYALVGAARRCGRLRVRYPHAYRCDEGCKDTRSRCAQRAGCSYRSRRRHRMRYFGG